VIDQNYFSICIICLYRDKMYVPCPDDICVVGEVWLVISTIWIWM